MVVSVTKSALESWSGKLALPCIAHAGKTVDRIEQQRASDAAYPVSLRLGRDVFHRRLAVDAPEKQPGQQMRGAFLDVGARFPGNARQIAPGQRLVALKVTCLPLWPPQAFEQQMIQTERQIECRIAVPRAFGVEKHRPVRSRQNILRADVARHQP